MAYEPTKWNCRATGEETGKFKCECKNVAINSTGNECDEDVEILISNLSDLRDYGDLINYDKLHITDSTIKCIPYNILTKFSNLDRFEAKDIGIEFLNANSFAGAENLTVLRLDNNKITNLPENIFKNAPKLQKIFLEGNQIEKIDKNAFADLKSLKELYLKNNKITILEDGLFASNTELKKIDLKNNQIAAIGPNAFIMSRSYDSLTLNGCLEIEEDTFTGKTNKEIVRCFMPYLTEKNNKIQIENEKANKDLEKRLKTDLDEVKNETEEKLGKVSTEIEVLKQIENKTMENQKKIDDLTDGKSEMIQMASYGFIGLVAINFILIIIVLASCARSNKQRPVESDVDSGFGVEASDGRLMEVKVNSYDSDSDQSDEEEMDKKDKRSGKKGGKKIKVSKQIVKKKKKELSDSNDSELVSNTSDSDSDSE